MYINQLTFNYPDRTIEMECPRLRIYRLISKGYDEIDIA